MTDYPDIPDPENRFTGLPLEVSYIDGRNWRMLRDISYRTAAGETSTVRAGFDFDFATIPRALWGRFPPTGEGKDYYGLAATWHDWLYCHRKIEGRIIGRKEADDLFLEIMLYIKVRPWVAKTFWAAVRIFGWIVWNRRKPEDIIP